MKITDEKELRKIANDVRIDIINEVYSAKSGHPGGALSIADILTVLYFNQMNINPEMPESNLRDRLVLSKGHASAALYAVLAERGFINKEDLKTFRKFIHTFPCRCQLIAFVIRIDYLLSVQLISNIVAEGINCKR